MNDLPDVNVWLALSVQDHPHHVRATTYWRGEGAAERLFCRTTWLALPRLLSDRRVLGGRALDGPSAWGILQQWEAQPRVAFRDELAGTEELLRGWSGSLDLRGGDWTDAYLAALAIAGDLRLVTFDRGFERFPGLSWLHLEPAA